MYQHKCKLCTNEFQSKQKNRKYCSDKCYTDSKVGKKQSKTTIEKRRNSMIGQVMTETRKKNIALANQKRLSEEIIIKMKDLLDFGMPDGYIMEKLNISRKVYDRYKKEFHPDGILWQMKFLLKKIEKILIEEIIGFSKIGYKYKRIAEKVSLDPKTVKKILKTLNKKDETIKCLSYDKGLIPESKPEKTIREFLNEMGIANKPQAQINNESKLLYDFFILNSSLLIEVQGDFWHCNPKVYIDGPINKIQKRAIIRDEKKKKHAEKLGYNVYYVWEYDINNNQEITKQKLLEEIKNATINN